MDISSTLLSPEVLRNRYSMYSLLRNTQPVMGLGDYGLWMVFSYQDVSTVLSDYDSFSSDFRRMRSAPGSEYLEMAMGNNPHAGFGTSLISSDPPRHRQLRDLVNRAFTPRAVANLEPRIAELTRQMLDEVIEAGQMDLIHDLAYPLPVVVISEMLGVPPEDRAMFKRWSDQVVASSDNFLADPGTRRAQFQAQQTATAEMFDYFRYILKQRRAEPQDDLISGLLAAEINGEHLSEQDLLSFCWLLLVAGNVTTTNLIGNAILCFLDHPEEFARLRADPSLLPSAIEEVLRYLSPVQGMFRIAARDMELGGQTIPAGGRVMAWIGSANRDEAKFPDPDRFDIARQPNQHLGFGLGIHYCLGAPLARLEARLVLSAILERLENLERASDEPLPLAQGIILYGVTSLPLRFAPAPRLGG